MYLSCSELSDSLENDLNFGAFFFDEGTPNLRQIIRHRNHRLLLQLGARNKLHKSRSFSNEFHNYEPIS